MVSTFFLYFFNFILIYFYKDNVYATYWEQRLSFWRREARHGKAQNSSFVFFTKKARAVWTTTLAENSNEQRSLFMYAMTL